VQIMPPPVKDVFANLKTLARCGRTPAPMSRPLCPAQKTLKFEVKPAIGFFRAGLESKVAAAVSGSRGVVSRSLTSLKRRRHTAALGIVEARCRCPLPSLANPSRFHPQRDSRSCRSRV
jgi:hypothetical protein